MFRTEKSSLAVFAVVWPLTEMDELMSFHIRSIGETFAASGELAYVWAFAGMYPNMSCQGGLLRKAFSAVIRTYMRPLAGMLLHMSLQAKSRAEATVASLRLAFEWLFFRRR
mmetsp:Transcript_24140/g.45140  ORF Transcript_24140/g.45140 Transcript_24140/m.45140 type:complete len:112 (-) Transcript_24140:950-1285(-)